MWLEARQTCHLITVQANSQHARPWGRIYRAGLPRKTVYVIPQDKNLLYSSLELSKSGISRALGNAASSRTWGNPMGWGHSRADTGSVSIGRAWTPDSQACAHCINSYCSATKYMTLSKLLSHSGNSFPYLCKKEFNSMVLIYHNFQSFLSNIPE